MTTANAPVYMDRDLSWLEFNRRVLHEAIDPRTPLLERVKFLAIFGSNLDEFFMKRAARLSRAGTGTPGIADGGAEHAGDSPLGRVRTKVLQLIQLQADVYRTAIVPALAAAGIHVLTWHELTEHQREAAYRYFRKNVFPVLTPLAVDPGHPFPFLSNLSSSLGLLLTAPGADEPLFARVKVPDVFPQWVSLPDEPGNGTPAGNHAYLRLLDLIRANLADLFPGMTVLEVMPFRITRDAEVESDGDEPDTLAEQVEEQLRARRFEEPVRLEYMPEGGVTQLPFLTRKLGLSELDVYPMPGELDFTDLFYIAGLNRPDLRDLPWQPLVPPAFADEDRDIFSAIRAGDILVHHPYESFDGTVARFIRAAAEDPKVLALKMTVYRVGSDTSFLDSMIAAAEAGKQVACLVEVTARFDERQNLMMAQALEKAGVHVVYGVVGLKTHCKTALVVRHDDDGIRCYAHIGTGNYNVKTSRLYTDLGLFTCDPGLTSDVVDLFHYLTGRSLHKGYHKLLVAPVTMRDRFMAMIEQEITNHAAGRPARIIAKMNQLEDLSMCDALIRASRAGVPIRLIVRGFCVLLPGVPGVTETINVTSVIGRFLEHSRIFYFQSGVEDPLGGSYFVGSADWMERNLSQRVEVITPVESRPLRERLWSILQTLLEDQRQAWDLGSNGTYTQRQPGPDATPTQRQGTHVALMMRQTRERAGLNDAHEPAAV